MRYFLGIILIGLLANCSERPKFQNLQKTAQESNDTVSTKDGTANDQGSNNSQAASDDSSNAKTQDKAGINTSSTSSAQDDGSALYAFDGAFPIAAGLMATNWKWKADGLVGWGSANSFTVLVDYMYVTGSSEYKYMIDMVYNQNVDKGEKNFINEFYDDTAWWGLAWVRAYDVTKDQKYLNAAKTIADYIFKNGWDEKVCNGGLWWKRQEYKASISNELSLKLVASLHNRIPGDTNYLDLAKKEWKWFVDMGLAGSDGLVKDGLDGDCKPTGGVYSYNQGVILGAAAELYLATKDQQYLDFGNKLVDASIKAFTDSNGILQDQIGGECKPGNGSGDGVYFKGAYVRNVREYNTLVKSDKISSALKSSAESAWKNARGDFDALGICWQGKSDIMSSDRQTIGLDLMTSVVPQKTKNLALNKKATTTAPSCKDSEGISNLTDGSSETKWCAKSDTPDFVADIDLGAAQQLHRIRIAHAGVGTTMLDENKDLNTKDFEILVADQASGPWRVVDKVSGNTSSGTSHLIKDKAQFIRLHVTNPGSDGIVRIYEIFVE